MELQNIKYFSQLAGVDANINSVPKILWILSSKELYNEAIDLIAYLINGGQMPLTYYPVPLDIRSIDDVIVVTQDILLKNMGFPLLALLVLNRIYWY